jgi:CBS domain-containing protein
MLRGAKAKRAHEHGSCCWRAVGCPENVCAYSPDDSLATAETLMKELQVRRLPVVDGFGELVGD